MAVAFVGTHIPLLTLLFYFISTSAIAPDNRLRIFGIALLATLMGAAATLLALHHLLSPIGLTAFALRNYWNKQQLPALPTQYTDDAGILMANTTQIVRQLDDFIRYVADYDNLTGLPNRDLFKKRLQKEILTVQPQRRMIVFIIDIDGFKNLNTVENDEVGDHILRAIAQRLTDYAGGSSRLARLGNDEFALFTESSSALEPGFSTAPDILRLLNQPYLKIPSNPYITVSIGISIYPTDSDSADRLITDAYTALQQAKYTSNSCQFYSSAIAITLQKRLRLAQDLRSALTNNQLLLHYQPRIDWRSREMVGAECLVRWQHPELGWVSPAEFIPIAEETGLILPIGEWILRTACQQNKAWQRSGIKPFAIAVNLSARQIESAGLVDLVQLILKETELAPQFLELEVTESLLMGNIEPTLAVLETLHSQGVALALDDFGTGYSSLSYLRKFPFDTLKIDQSFVKDMVHSADAAEVIRAIVSLAKGLRLGLIAEGIETEEQLNQIKTYDCHEVQGYYFSRPLPADELIYRLQQPHPWQNTAQASLLPPPLTM